MPSTITRALRRVSILTCPGVFASTAMQARDIFHLANLRQARQRDATPGEAFQVRLVSVNGAPVTSFNGSELAVDGVLEDSEVIILPAFWGDFERLRDSHTDVLDWLRQAHARGSTLCGEANGVYWMAAAGLLDGREATTYWRCFEDFERRFPNVMLNRDKHLTDAGELFCAAGQTSSGDLYAHLIERFCGATVAQGVSGDIFYEVQRAYSPGPLGFGGQKLHRDPAVLQVQQWLEAHYGEKFRFEDVARQHGMSIRNFMRRFQAATGDRPLHYLQRLRVETAKQLLAHSGKSIKTIGYDVGYDDASFFARLFRQHVGCTPNAYRLRQQGRG